MKKISKDLYYNDTYFDAMMPPEVVKFFPDENSDYPFFIYENFFSEKMCIQVEQKIKMNTQMKVGTGTLKNQHYDETVRNTYAFYINNEVRDIYTKKFNMIKNEIENFYKIKIGMAEGMQALGYEEGCRFLYHSDNSSFYVDPDTQFISNWKVEKASRVLSVILFLTDCVEQITGVNQCTGGELSFLFINDEKGNIFTFKPKKGTLIAFPSNPYYMHQVNDVKDGFRMSLVEWYNGNLS